MTEFEEKVIKLLETINDKLDKILKSPSSSGRSLVSSISSSTGAKPSAVVDKQEDEERTKGKPTVDGRRTCPGCGATEFNATDDKSKILHSMGGVKIYAKKYECKKCGREA